MKQFHLKSTLSAALVLAITLTFSCSGGDDGDSSSGGSGGSSSPSGGGGNFNYGSVKDNNGKTYKTIKIGDQTWMAENLNYNASGSKCGSVLTGSGTVGDANTTTCDTYGRLYNWATAMDLPSKCNTTLSTSDADCTIRTPNHRGICPSGWHIPSDAEWDALMTSVGGASTAGTKLKATTDWNSYNGVPAGTDTYGFSALPGGCGNSHGSFDYVGYGGLWWSASEYDSYYAYLRDMGYDFESAGWGYLSKIILCSVRCLQD